MIRCVLFAGEGEGGSVVLWVVCTVDGEILLPIGYIAEDALDGLSEVGFVASFKSEPYCGGIEAEVAGCIHGESNFGSPGFICLRPFKLWVLGIVA